MYNVATIPEFLSSFFSRYTVQGHLDLVETANIRDADNERIFLRIYKIVTKPDYCKEGLWMLVPLEFESPKLCGWILSQLHFFLILKSRSHRQDKTQKSDLVTLLPLLMFWKIMIRAQIIEIDP